MRSGQPLGSSPYLVTLRDRTYVESLGSGAGYTEMELKLVDNGISDWMLRFPGAHPAAAKLAEKGSGLVVRPAGSDKVILSGQMKSAVRTLSVNEDSGEISDEWEIRGTSDEFVLFAEPCFAPSTVDIPTGQLTSGLTRSRDLRVPAETALLNVIRHNISSQANLTRRRYPWLIVPASQGRGATVTRNDRLNSILESVQKVALAGGLSFSLRQSAPGQVSVSVRVPQVRPEARWALGVNVSAVSYGVYAPECDEAVVGGQETDDSPETRVFTRVVLAGSAADWGHRTVKFVDTSEEELPELQQAGNEAIEDGRARAGLSITPTETPGLRYGVHYELGDIGTAVVGSTTVTDRITQVVIRHQPGRAPSVKPSIGAPDESESPAWLKPVQRLVRQLGPFRRR